MKFDNLECMDTLANHGAFLCSGDNVMIIGWGMIGKMWRKKVFAVPVRESRYTKQFMDATREFTVSVPRDGEMLDKIKFCGTKSGRDYDKWKECAMQRVPTKSVGEVVVGDCCRYFECKIIGEFSMQDMDLSEVAGCYPTDDRHTLYIGEIVEEY